MSAEVGSHEHGGVVIMSAELGSHEGRCGSICSMLVA